MPCQPRLVEHVCPSRRCGRTFIGRTRRIYCSPSCASSEQMLRRNALCPPVGENNPNFKNWASKQKRRYVDNFRARYPEKAKAHDAVKNALAKKILVRPAFCACGQAHPHAHHEDYSKPLDVIWVCRDCHHELDRERRVLLGMGRHPNQKTAVSA